MDRIRIIALCLLLAVLSLLGLTAVTDESLPCTIVVHVGESIQEAINDAPSAAVICLDEGQWIESLTIRGSITLRGAVGGSVIIGHIEDSPVIRVLSMEDEHVAVSILGLSLVGGEKSAGCLLAQGESEVLLESCVISGNGGYGIKLREVSRANILDCRVSMSSGHGIRLRDFSTATISDSTIVENGQDGIGVWESAVASITNSMSSANGRYGVGLGDLAQVTLSGCSISDNSIGVWLWGSAHLTMIGNSVADNHSYAITLYTRGCSTTSYAFNGFVTGSNNSISGAEAVCPRALLFLGSPDGGQLDWRK